MQLYDYHGMYQHGFFNSVLGQKDCLVTTNGYNYIALDDDVQVYTGITSVNGDQSNVGFVLINQRTMETQIYRVRAPRKCPPCPPRKGRHRTWATGQPSPFLNIADEPTYFMAFKDSRRPGENTPW